MDQIQPSRRERFEALYAAHYRDVHRFALRRTDPAAAEEIANEVFVVCWRKLDGVPDQPLPWLYTVARNCIGNQRRTASRQQRRERAAADEQRTAPPAARDPAERFAESDNVLRAFTALPERDREALRLVAWEDLPLAAAARAAGTSRTAFAMRLHRARRRLAARLDELETTPARPLENAHDPA